MFYSNNYCNNNATNADSDVIWARVNESYGVQHLMMLIVFIPKGIRISFIMMLIM